MTYLLFSKKSWFNIYIDFMSFAALILSYVVFLISRLASYFYDKRNEINKTGGGVGSERII